MFPEEFDTFLLTNPKIRKIFRQHHKDLLDVKFWQHTQANLNNGVYEDAFPYPQKLRFKR